ncbi:MAG: dTDP-4-dehydrorhamnose 3,5-epimerase [Ignavibacteriales bacterium]|nr:dTDP-4-dehydrorhamnose 3,5-epimerase [Ignavibacteriales bacterium]
MKIENTIIDGLLIIQPDIFRDDRGYFFESYSLNRYSEAGLNVNFVQDNISKSTKNTIRGLHYQIGGHAQGKLCQVLLGEVIDVAVDIRFGSSTYGKYFSIILSEKNKTQFFIPPGFAHGFGVLSEIAIFSYKCTEHYNNESERIIIFNDKELNIDWKIVSPIVSEKDLKGTNFKEIQNDFTI